MSSIKLGSVKICSLRDVEHAQFVVEAGADLFGLIFAPARRRVTIERAREIVEAVRQLSPDRRILAVGVFVDASIVEINNAISDAGLDLVQLHGNEPPEMLASLDALAIKAIRPAPGETFDMIAARIEDFASATAPPVAFLIDGFSPDHAGGQGIRADWTMARRIADRWPAMLAGGLSGESIAAGIRAVEPLGVDVSSGVETDGLKDRSKIIEFTANAQSAFSTHSRRSRP